MDSEAFRKHGYAVIDWIADYHERLEAMPVRARIEPGEVRAKLPLEPPEQGEPFEAMLADVDEIVVPGLTHWQSPSFFGFFPANASPPAILGDLVSAGLGVQGMMWETSPACTEIETHMLDWLVAMLGLPERFLSTGDGGGVIQDTASSATLCALLAARERATDWATREHGLQRRMTVYASNQAHSLIEKAVIIAGLGSANLRLVDVDERGAMRTDELARRIAADRKAGHLPIFCCATVGTTGVHGVDAVEAIASVCAEHDVWLHVDSAMLGTAALCPEHRWIHRGVEHADSLCWNPHKWMLTNFDCDCFWVADRAALIRTLSVLPEYLRNKATESGAVFDYRDWQVPLGRRFRALKLWFVIRHYGVEGLRAKIRHDIRIAQDLAVRIREHADFELAPTAQGPQFSLVCFRHREGDQASERIVQRVNDSGRAYLTHTRFGDHYVIRMAIGGTNTKRRHVEATWESICSV